MIYIETGFFLTGSARGDYMLFRQDCLRIRVLKFPLSPDCSANGHLLSGDLTGYLKAMAGNRLLQIINPFFKLSYLNGVRDLQYYGIWHL